MATQVNRQESDDNPGWREGAERQDVDIGVVEVIVEAATKECGTTTLVAKGEECHHCKRDGNMQEMEQDLIDEGITEVIVEAGTKECDTTALVDKGEERHHCKSDGNLQEMEQDLTDKGIAEVIVEAATKECDTAALVDKGEERHHCISDGNLQEMEQDLIDEGVTVVIVEIAAKECGTAALIDKGEERHHWKSDGNIQEMEQDITDKECIQSTEKPSGKGQEMHVPLRHNEEFYEQHPGETSSGSEEQRTFSSGLPTDTSGCNKNVCSDPKPVELNQQESVNRTIDNNNICEAGDKLYKCQFCETSFKQKCDWIKHEQEHNLKNSHIHNSREHHELGPAVQKVWECQFCSLLFVSGDSLKEHLKSHDGKIPTVLQSCDRDITGKGKIRETEERKSFKCQFCLKSFGRRQADCERHESLHLSDKSFKCHLCETLFRTKYKYEAHLKKHAATDSASENVDTTVLECQLCNTFFVTEESLKEHLKSHADEMPTELKNRKKDTKPQDKTHVKKGKKDYTCRFCLKSFGRRWDSCEKHELTHVRKNKTLGKNLKCYFCEKVFSTKVRCTLHEMREHEAKCRHCEKSFASLCDLKTHELTHTDIKLFRCGYCDKIFKLSVNRRRHEMTHTGEKPYQCSYCNKAFRLVHHRKRHIRHMHKGSADLAEDSVEEHNDGIPTVRQFCEIDPTEMDKTQKTEEIKYFKCRFCLKSFGRRQADCKKHELLHLSDKSFKCDLCETLFRTKHKYEAHLKRHAATDSASENIDATVLECPLCNTFFVTEESLKKHLKSHADKLTTENENGKKDHTCRFCLKSFGRRWDRCEKHEMTHVSNVRKNFKCYFCEKVFNTKVRCTLHEMMEHAEAKCRYCEKSFASLCDLKIHELTHTDIKLFRCGYCDKVFKQSQNRRRHEMTHTGQKPYMCSYCNKAFRLVHHRKKHERRMHKQNTEV